MMLGQSATSRTIRSSTGTFTTTWTTWTCLFWISVMEGGINQRQNRFRLLFLWDIFTWLDEEEDELPPFPFLSSPWPPKWLSLWFMTSLQLLFLAVFGDFSDGLAINTSSQPNWFTTSWKLFGKLRNETISMSQSPRSEKHRQRENTDSFVWAVDFSCRFWQENSARRRERVNVWTEKRCTYRRQRTSTRARQQGGL